MASFKQRYDELFGESPPYDPIELSDRTASRATSIQEGAPTASPKRALPLYEPNYAVKKGGGDSGVLGNVGRELGAGVMDVADMALGAAGYAADFFVPEQVDDFVMDTIYSGRQGIREVTESIRSGISEDAKQKAASELLTLDPNRTIWSGNPLDVAEAILYKTARALPATVATLAPPIAFAKAGATAKAITYMGASEGTLSMGGIANGIQDEIMAIPTEQLLQESPRFAEILKSNGGDADAARNDLIREARGFAPLVGGATVAAISSAAGRYFTPIFEKGTEAVGASLGRRVGTGFAAEAPQEASQGASEQFVQNYSAKIYDLDRQLSEGVAEAAAQEGLIGGIMGAGAGGVFGQRPAAPPPPPGPPIDPNARPELTEQPDLPGIEPGGPDGTLPDAMDQPTPEPSGDIQAQLNDMWDDNNPRRAVFVPPGQNYDYLQVPPGVEDYIFEDGSALIAKDPAVIEEALARLDAGESKQAVVGSLIGVGEGKPTNPASRVVQLLDKQGNVTRESVVATQAEAEALGVTWSKEKENKDRRVTIMSPREALERRQALGQENTIPIQEDLFDNTAARGTEGAMVPAEPGPPGQLDLPLTRGTRRRGVGRIPMSEEDEIVGPQGVPYRTRGPDGLGTEGEDRVGAAPTGQATDRAPIQLDNWAVGPDGMPYRTRGPDGLGTEGEDRVGPVVDRPRDDTDRPTNQRDDPNAVAERQYGMNFDEPTTETVNRRTTRKVGTPDTAVQIIDNGEVIEEHRYGSVERAEQAADEFAAEFPDFDIRVAPATRTEVQVETRAKVKEPRPIEPVVEQSIEEEVQDEIRANIPFEERDGPLAAVKGSRSVGQAADKLTSEAAAVYDEEQKARIGGFYNPDRLQFTPKKAPPRKDDKPNKALQKKLDAEMAAYEQEYRDAWDQLSRMKETTKGPRRQRLLKKLGKVRQIAKPKLIPSKSDTYVKAARVVNPAEVSETVKAAESPTDKDDAAVEEARRNKAESKSLRLTPLNEEVPNYTVSTKVGSTLNPRAEEQDYIGEFKAKTREQLDRLADYVVRWKTPKAKEWTEETFNSGPEAYARRDEIKKRYPSRTVTVDVVGTQALDAEFERAVRYREGREAVGRQEGGVKVKGRTRPAVRYKNKDGVNVTRAFDTEAEAQSYLKEIGKGEIIFQSIPDKLVRGMEKKELERERKEQDKADAVAEAKAAAANKSARAGVETRAVTGNEATFADLTDEDATPTQEDELAGLGVEIADTNIPDYRATENTPGKKLKFIRREVENKKRQETGQRSIKATTVRRVVTKSELKRRKGETEQAYNKRVEQSEKGRKFDTQPLTTENLPLDESVSDRVKRVAKAKAVRAELGKAATRASRMLREYKQKGTRYVMGEAYGAKVEKDFLYARNYLEQLIQFARSIQATKSDTNQSIALAEGITKMLNAVENMQADQFATKWGAVARANEFDDLANLKFTSLASMRVPSKRAEATSKTNREIMTRKENREFMDSMKDNQLFTAMIGPVLQKMSGYVLDNAEGIPTQPYIPNELEMAEIIYAMQTFKNNWNANRIPSITKGRVAKTLGKPDTTGVYNKLRKQMERLGFQFNKSGNITGFEGTEEYMGARERSMFKGQQEKGGAEIERGTAQTLTKQKPAEDAPKVTPRNDSTLRPQVVKEEQSVEEAVAALDARKAKKKVKEQDYEVEPGLLQIDAVNGLIDRLKKATTAKTTISGIKRAEQRFIRGLKQLGAWRDTAPGIGTIVLPNKTKTYRLVGPRLDKKAIKAGQAKDALRRLAKFAIPKNMLADVKRARADTETRAGLDKFLDDAALDLFNDAAGPIKYDAEYIGVANRVNELMTDGKITGQDVVDAIMEIAPQNSFYRNLATRLNAKDVGNVEVTFGTQEDFPDGQLGKYSRANNRIILNRDALNMSDLTADSAYGARVVHTLTHELVHAQTHAAIDNSPLLRRRIEELQTRAREMWQSRVGGKMPYGLKVLEKSQNEAHEFVAEAFSNHEFQQFLKETPAAPQTFGDLWTSFVEAVRNILGLPPREVSNSLFDAIMMQENILFDDAGIGGVAQGDLYMTGEAVIDNVSSLVHDTVQKSFPVWDKIKNASRNLMTFEQLHDTYTKYFDGAEGGNPFTRYMDAWKRRNAAVSKNMKLPEKISVKWTTLEATDPDAALELSRIGTEATIERLTPSKELTAKERSEVADVRLKKYDELRARYKALPAPAQALYDEARAYYKGAAQEEAKLLLSASLRGVLTKGPNAVMTQAEYKARFTEATLNEMKDADSITAELKDLVPEEQIQGLVKELQRMSSLRQLGFGDYFPLMRYGEYTVYKSTQRPDKVYDDKGEAFGERRRLLQEDPTLDVDVIDKGDKAVLRVMEKEFWMFESKTEAKKKAAELGSTVEARLSTESGGTAITSNAGLNTILTSLKDNPAAQAAIKEHYLRSLSDQAFRKHELKRKNRVGVNYDIQHRNLATYMKQSSHYRAQLQYGWQMGEALQDMRKYTHGRPDGGGITTEQLQQVYKQVKMRDEMVNDNTQLMKWVREGVNVTQFMMLTSPSYWMINSSQPWLVTAPIMGGRYGMGNSYSALKDAMRLVKGPLWSQVKASRAGLKAFTDPVATEDAFNVVDQVLESVKQSGDPRADDIVELIDDLRDQNIIDINVLTELRQIAEGTQGTAWTNTLDASRILAHITEVSNRTITAIAAYNLVMNDGGTKEQAKQYAADMVSQTQFNYSSENKPPLFQPGGPLKWAAPLMFQFMQWPQHMYALLIRNVAASVKGGTAEERAKARKSVLGLLGTHAAVGGMVGMALQPIKWAFGMAMFAFGDDDEPYTFAQAINGRTFDNLVAEALTELFGVKAGRAVSHGLPTLLGTDLSARMSMGTLYFVDLRGDTAESVLGSLAASFGGATLNQMMNWGNALGKVGRGDVMRGVEQASPKILRDAIRSVRYYNDGLVNNAGDTVIDAKDMSFAEVFLQSIGFSPDEVSQFYSSQAAIKGAQGYARDRRDALVKSFVNDGMTAEVMREVMEFNRAYPSLRITRSSLIRGARSQVERESRYRRYGANIDEKQARDFADYGESYRD